MTTQKGRPPFGCTGIFTEGGFIIINRTFSRNQAINTLTNERACFQCQVSPDNERMIFQSRPKQTYRKCRTSVFIVRGHSNDSWLETTVLLYHFGELAKGHCDSTGRIMLQSAVPVVGSSCSSSITHDTSCYMIIFRFVYISFLFVHSNEGFLRVRIAAFLWALAGKSRRGEMSSAAWLINQLDFFRRLFNFAGAGFGCVLNIAINWRALLGVC